MTDKREENNIKSQWSSLGRERSLSTKEKLDKLVKTNLKKSKLKSKLELTKETLKNETDKPYIIKDSFFSLENQYGDIKLSEWDDISQSSISLLFTDEKLKDIDVKKILYFDTETTGLSGGTGTIPFMLGFGYFADKGFKTKIFILNDLNAEEEMLERVDDFINSNGFSATITYNGKSYDFPLMETRYILNRKRFSLLKIPHLDFLYPARIIWKNTFESRRLGYLGDVLLGISREEDIDGSQIPALYFSYIRTGNFRLIESVIYHNELDLVGLSALVLKSLKYIEDENNVDDEGEILGVANLYEKVFNLKKAEEKYSNLISNCEKDCIRDIAVKRLSILKKKMKLYEEAHDLWKILEDKKDIESYRELAIYYEHRNINYFKALEYAKKGLNSDMSDYRKRDLLKRIERLQKKINKIEKEIK